MAVLSSHLLNGVDGTHAGEVTVTLIQIAADGERSVVFEEKSDQGGRFLQDVAVVTDSGYGYGYEMVIASGAYFSRRDIPVTGTQILREIVIRFSMPDPDARYHIPVIMSPNSYSCWWSS